MRESRQDSIASKRASPNPNVVELSSLVPSPFGGELARGPLGWGRDKSVASQLFDYPHPGLPPLGKVLVQ